MRAIRTTFHEAHRAFESGHTIAVSERGHETEFPVTDSTTTHNMLSTTWPELVAQVRMWQSRYPNQRYYIVTAV